MQLKHDLKVQNYLKAICLKIKNRKVHQEIELELLGHLEEIYVEYREDGLSEEEAIAKAITKMGDADLIGQELNKIHKAQPDWGLVLISFILASFGLTAMYFIEDQGVLQHNFGIFSRSLFFSILGVGVLVGFYFLDYRKIKNYSQHIYIGTLVLVFYTLLNGNAVNGLKAWVTIGPLSINVISISPLLFILALAGLLEEWKWYETISFLKGLVLVLLPAVLFLIAPSFSALVVYAIALTVLIIISGVKPKNILLISIPLIGFISIFAFNAGYSIARLLVFLNPSQDPQGAGWIHLQLRELKQSSGLFGQGFTLGPGILPEAHTDFVFTYLVYTFGWIAGIAILCLIGSFLFRMGRISMVVKDTYGKLLISGLVTIFAVQFIWNVLMNLGFAPMTSISLPFLSFGGSQFMVNMASLGITSNIYKWRNIGEMSKS